MMTCVRVYVYVYCVEAMHMHREICYSCVGPGTSQLRLQLCVSVCVGVLDEKSVGPTLLHLLGSCRKLMTVPYRVLGTVRYGLGPR